MGGDDSDTDSDDNSTGVVEVGTVPTSAAAAILISKPPVAATLPAPVAIPTAVPVAPPVVATRPQVPIPVPVAQNAPISRTPVLASQVAQRSHVNMPPGSVPGNSQVHNRANMNPSSAPMPRSSIPSVSNPVSTVNSGSSQATTMSRQDQRLKSLYSQSAAQHQSYQQQQAQQQHVQRKAYQQVAPTAPSSIPHSHDAFEPTPLKVIQAKNNSNPVSSQHPMHPIHHQPAPVAQSRHPHHNRIQQQPPPSQQHPFRPKASHPRSSPSMQQQSSQPSASPQEQKSRKERFLMFTRVLMKYLEQKDPTMHGRAKEVIRQCAKKNKEGDPNFASLSASMQSHLKKLVGETYWKKAQEYLRQYMMGQNQKQGMSAKEAKIKADKVAEIAAAPLPANTVSLPPPTTRITTQPTSASGVWKKNNSSGNSNRVQSKPTAPVQSALKSIPEAKKRKPATKKKDKDKSASKSSTASGGTPRSTSSGGKNSTSQANAGAATTTTSGKTNKGKKTSSSTSSSKKNSSSTASTAPIQRPEPKEYSELLEMLDHVVDYDVASCAMIFGNGNSQRGELNISEEQKKLIYHDFGMPGGPRKGLYGGTKISDEKNEIESSSKLSEIPPYLKGWGSHNLVSTRCAWAKLRLAERDAQNISEISLPSISLKAKGFKSEEVDLHESWFNEDKAEEDKTLALISEATQQYIKTILEGGMNTATQRLNLDGIRLWYQQHTSADIITKAAQSSTPPVTVNGDSKPPLSIRLGCDVRRQYSMVQGNAAKTSQRFEEALSRRSETKDLDAEAMFHAVSMTDLSQIPTISSAAKKADYNAKRIFEVHGGKDANKPPLGRVPKKAKIMVKDFRACLSNSSFVINKKRLPTSAFA